MGHPRLPRAGSTRAGSLAPPGLPALAVLVPFAVGIAADRWLSLPWTTWLLASAAFVCAWAAASAWGRRRFAAAACLLMCLCIGGARHHQFWSAARPDDVSTVLAREPKLVRLRGVAAERPWIRHAEKADWEGPPRPDVSACVVECRSLVGLRERLRVSGLCRLYVSGHLLHVEAGDEVEIDGWLSRPRKPGNPGEFDFAAYLRSSGCRAVLRATHPDAVRVVKDGRRIAGGIESLRERCESLLVRHLSEDNVAVGSALLLGERSLMTHELRTRFIESGTMHVLAISGLHVGILVWFVWIGCRWSNVSPFSRLLVICFTLAIYALLTGGRPPVIRAAILVFFGAVGLYWNRRWSLANALAVAALVILAWNPSNLFETGTQLSFLAVTGIIAAQAWLGGRGRDSYAAIERPTLMRRAGRRVADGYVVVLFIWLFTLPLVAAVFHVISPIGLAINVLLLPAVALVLGTGYLFLFCGLAFAPLAGYLGPVFDAGLGMLLALVERSAEFHLGHLYVAGPSTWWLCGYYVLLAALLPVLYRRRGRGWTWRALLLWLVVGLGAGMLPQKAPRLRCTFLDMGHGCSVLLQLPGGRTVVYDAGTLQNPERAQRTVQQALWSYGVDRIDAVVVSHADVDHFNGVLGMVDTMAVGTLLVSPTFLDYERQPVAELCRKAENRGVRLRLTAAGDRLALDERVTIEVLQPAANERFESDNANSLVLLIAYGGRRILLAGDLERDGLSRLLNSPPTKLDVLLAPHHGSTAANPEALAEWGKPDWVVASTRESRSLSRLRGTYGPAIRVLSTAEEGAVTVTVGADGETRVSSYRSKPSGGVPWDAGAQSKIPHGLRAAAEIPVSP